MRTRNAFICHGIYMFSEPENITPERGLSGWLSGQNVPALPDSSSAALAAVICLIVLVMVFRQKPMLPVSRPVRPGIERLLWAGLVCTGIVTTCLTDSPPSQTVRSAEQPLPDPGSSPVRQPDPCRSLNEALFTGMDGYYFLRLYHRNQDTYEFTGKLEARDVNGFVRHSGNELRVIAGNITGRFTLLNNCRQITGHFTDGFGTSVSFDYHR